ncbi:MAG TPA: hypothetical protein VF610_05040, partial [Segetibacter sp.]
TVHFAWFEEPPLRFLASHSCTYNSILPRVLCENLECEVAQLLLVTGKIVAKFIKISVGKYMGDSNNLAFYLLTFNVPSSHLPFAK